MIFEEIWISVTNDDLLINLTGSICTDRVVVMTKAKTPSIFCRKVVSTCLPFLLYVLTRLIRRPIALQSMTLTQRLIAVGKHFSSSTSLWLLTGSRKRIQWHLLLACFALTKICFVIAVVAVCTWSPLIITGCKTLVSSMGLRALLQSHWRLQGGYFEKPKLDVLLCNG